MEESALLDRVCPNCSATELSTNDLGHISCDVCGYQLVDILSQEQEFQGKSHLTSKVARVRVDAVEDQETVRLPGHRSCIILESMSFLFRLQAKTLVDRTNVSPRVFDMSGRLWLLLLKQWNENGWGESEKQAMFCFNNKFLVDSKRDNQPQRNDCMDLEDIYGLVLVYLSCRILRQGLLAVDIVRMANNETLPYFSSWKHLPEDLRAQVVSIKCEALFHPWRPIKSCCNQRLAYEYELFMQLRKWLRPASVFVW
jgi:uncharacterized Zn finger protein (UPF0148 family)